MPDAVFPLFAPSLSRARLTPRMWFFMFRHFSRLTLCVFALTMFFFFFF